MACNKPFLQSGPLDSRRPTQPSQGPHPLFPSANGFHTCQLIVPDFASFFICSQIDLMTLSFLVPQSASTLIICFCALCILALRQGVPTPDKHVFKAFTWVHLHGTLQTLSIKFTLKCNQSHLACPSHLRPLPMKSVCQACSCYKTDFIVEPTTLFVLEPFMTLSIMSIKIVAHAWWKLFDQALP